MDILAPARNSKMGIGEVYYWTSTIYQWKRLLKPEKYKQVIVNSLCTLCERQRIKVYGFVIMPNHIHLLWEILKMNGKEMPHASFNKFTAHSIQKDLRIHHQKALQSFRVDEKERKYRFWQRDPLAVKVFDKQMAEQKLDYMHLNPLQSHWNLVDKPEDYYYSSASFYEQDNSNFSFLTHYCDRF